MLSHLWAFKFSDILDNKRLKLDYNILLHRPEWSGFSVEGDGAVLHTVKPADDCSGDIILRLFECKGAQSNVV